MKNSMRILSLCVVMMFVGTFSIFGRTSGGEIAKSKTISGTAVKITKDLRGEIKNIQFPGNSDMKPKTVHSLLAQLKAKCARWKIEEEATTPCEDALIAAAIATSLATLACSAGPTPLCFVMLAAELNALRLAYRACHGGSLASTKEFLAPKRRRPQFAG